VAAAILVGDIGTDKDRTPIEIWTNGLGLGGGGSLLGLVEKMT